MDKRAVIGVSSGKGHLKSPGSLPFFIFGLMSGLVICRYRIEYGQGLGFDSLFWSCVEWLSKLLIPYCLCPPASNGYLVELEMQTCSDLL